MNFIVLFIRGNDHVESILSSVLVILKNISIHSLNEELLTEKDQQQLFNY